MRIVHVTDSLDLARGGVVRAVLDLAELMAGRGHEIVVVVHDTAGSPEHWTGEGTPRLVEIGRPRRKLGRFDQSQLDALESEIAGADVVHLHAVWHPFLHQAARIADRRGVPYVNSVHGMLDDWSMAQSSLKKRLFLAAGASKTLKRAAAVHCTAQAELDQAEKYFGPARGVVAPLLFDLSPYRELPGPELAREHFSGQIDDRPAVLFLSRLHYKKGPDVFLRMLAELKGRGVECQGLIVGSGDEPYTAELRALTKQLGVEGDAKFLGLVTGEMKTSVYQLAGMFALPTSQENFGFVFPEALVCGTPVVTTRGVDTHPELTASGGAEIVERTPEAFAATVSGLFSDDERRRAMGERGRAWVLDFFEPERLGEVYDGLYDAARTGAQA